MFTVRERGEIPEPTKIIILNYLRNLAHLGCESSQTLNLISFLFFFLILIIPWIKKELKIIKIKRKKKERKCMYIYLHFSDWAFLSNSKQFFKTVSNTSKCSFLSGYNEVISLTNKFTRLLDYDYFRKLRCARLLDYDYF
jgi:hypothetical protein